MKTQHQEIILKDGDYFTALLADIHDAQQFIDFEVYIFNNDHAGSQLASALCMAARRGVKIRVLVDGVGTPNWGSELTASMEKVGIITKIYHPPPWISHWRYVNISSKSWLSSLKRLLSNVNSRNHRKSCMIDNKIIYIGSANITDHLLNVQDSKNIWRETSVKLIGAPMGELQYAFEKAWGKKVSLKKSIRTALTKVNPGNIFNLNYSFRLRRFFNNSLRKKIKNTKQRIWVANAYFIPDSKLLSSLIEARARGVDVRILLPNETDVFIVSMASKIFYYTLLKHGVIIYEYLPSILHQKILILDDWYLVGTSNLNHRSFRHDLEVDVVIQTLEAKTLLESDYLTDLSQSKIINLNDLKKYSSFQYLLGRLILFMRHWL